MIPVIAVTENPVHGVVSFHNGSAVKSARRRFPVQLGIPYFPVKPERKIGAVQYIGVGAGLGASYEMPWVLEKTRKQCYEGFSARRLADRYVETRYFLNSP